ncbi:hypothetical protein [Pandoravirus japonicus]|uniref:Uncharacterized protein n=1 Tax=Pandoravirus japonicus TaxID=2823154 RepID=A0A811BMM2_9VIRU|nr:hypothetical protein [Pandoravirus japonicus]
MGARFFLLLLFRSLSFLSLLLFFFFPSTKNPLFYPVSAQRDHIPWEEEGKKGAMAVCRTSAACASSLFFWQEPKKEDAKNKKKTDGVCDDGKATEKRHEGGARGGRRERYVAQFWMSEKKERPTFFL